MAAAEAMKGDNVPILLDVSAEPLARANLPVRVARDAREVLFRVRDARAMRGRCKGSPEIEGKIVLRVKLVPQHREHRV